MNLKFTKGNKARNLRMLRNTVLVYLWTWLALYLVLDNDIVIEAFHNARKNGELLEFFGAQGILIGLSAVMCIFIHINVKSWMKIALLDAYYAFFGWIPSIKRTHPKYLTTIRGMKWKKKQLEKALLALNEHNEEREAIEKDIKHLEFFLEYNKYWKKEQKIANEIARNDPEYLAELKRYKKRRDSFFTMRRRHLDEDKGVFLDDSYYYGEKPVAPKATKYIGPRRNLYFGGILFGVFHLIRAFFVPLIAPVPISIILVLIQLLLGGVKYGVLSAGIFLMILVVLAYIIHPDVDIEEKIYKRYEVSDLDANELFYTDPPMEVYMDTSSII